MGSYNTPNVETIELNYKLFLDKSVILYGESGTGKSTVVLDILYHLNKHVDQIIVFSPTDRQNNTYGGGIIPPPLIHYTFTPEIIETIWQRQAAMVETYKQANKGEALQSLLRRTGEAKFISAVEDAKNNYRNYISKLDPDDPETEDKIKTMTQLRDDLITLICKTAIRNKQDKLKAMDLTEDERKVITYINMNPRLIIIFDDCTDLLKKYAKSDIMMKLFYQGRWNHITIMIACHTDKAIEAEIKKNAFVSIFTGPSSARAYFTRASTNMDPEVKKTALNVIRDVFNGPVKHQKVLYIREREKFYKFVATKRPTFKFGSPLIWEYCNKIISTGTTMSSDNPFSHLFKV